MNLTAIKATLFEFNFVAFAQFKSRDSLFFIHLIYTLYNLH